MTFKNYKDQTVNITDEPEDYIEQHLTDEDIESWHNGEMTKHVQDLMNTAQVDCIQIWGSNSGQEPLSVIIC